MLRDPRSVARDAEFDRLKTGDELARSIAAKNRHNIGTMATFLLVRWFLVFLTALVVAVTADLYDEFGALAVAVFGVATLLFSLGYAILVERAVQRFRPLSPRFCSIYDRYFWWHERLWKLLATVPFSGTPFKNIVWRLVGVRIGRRVFDDGCSMPEKSLVAIGDDCTLNAGSVIQCHSLEDGTFKSDYSTLGAGCTLGIESFVHYGVTMGDGAVLDADAFLMKGEEVGAYTRWRGNPATELRERPAVTSPTLDPLSAARSLLAELRSAGSLELAPSSGIALSLFELDACRQREGELLALLPATEREEAASLGSSGRRSEYVASRALVRMLLSVDWREDVAPQAWQLGRTELGKLVIQAPVDTGIDVSISHTDGVIAVAMSDAYEVGVDVEPAPPVPAGAVAASGEDPVVWSVLSPPERARLAELPAADRPDSSCGCGRSRKPLPNAPEPGSRWTSSAWRPASSR